MDQRDDGPAAVPFSQPHCYLGFRDCRRNQIGPFRSAVPFCSEIRIKKGIWHKSGMGWPGMGFKEPARKEIRARQGQDWNGEIVKKNCRGILCRMVLRVSCRRGFCNREREPWTTIPTGVQLQVRQLVGFLLIVTTANRLRKVSMFTILVIIIVELLLENLQPPPPPRRILAFRLLHSLSSAPGPI